MPCHNDAALLYLFIKYIGDYSQPTGFEINYCGTKYFLTFGFLS